ncbi:MAG TPA: hypothetical protein VE621_14725 [Bryobacteraceae bacterium]|jgi:hypothetical protein|nr:hypothetical protein [Bryobacteraceae bacterium]
MSHQPKVTTDHDEIRRWAEKRGGVPARVRGTADDDDDPGLLRIDFPVDGPDPNLEPISWDEWFKKFDQKQLAFLYQDETSNGELSYFNKLVSRATVKDELEALERERSKSEPKSSERKSSSSKEREPVR